MSWLFSQALVVEYLAANSLDGEPSVQSNGKPTQQAYCAPDKMMAFSRLFRFGMTYKPLTEIPGEELSMSSVVAFHVKTLVSPATETDLTENDQECGEKWHGLLAKFDLDTHSWRTVQCSLLEDLNESLQTLPQWGMTVGGELYLLPTLVQNINENEFGLWLTPTATNISGRSQEAMEHRIKWRERLGRKTVPPGNLAEQIMLSGVIPCVDMKKPTMWGTPKAQDSRHALRDRGKGNLGEQVSGLHNGGKLNPTWTEWLMGWPLEWTDLKPLEMDKTPSVLPLPGES